MRRPLAPTESEIVVQKSRFLGLVRPVGTPEEARALLKDLKIRYEDATHVVHAFVTGKKNSLTTGYSDDGEPPGTAGRPVADLLKGADATGIFLAVVRWFGGTKLGTGGLVKAYGDCAREVLKIVAWEEDLPWMEFTLTLDYTLYDGLKRACLDRGGQILEEQFSDRVRVRGRLLEEKKSEWIQWVQDATRGAGGLQWNQELTHLTDGV